MTEILITFVSAAPVTFILALIILLVSVTALLKPAVFSSLVFHPYSIVHKRAYHRLFTGDLVHVDLLHLAVNLMMLIFVCSELERKLSMLNDNGSLMYSAVYALSMLSGTVVETWRNRNEFRYSGAGASGSILGCMMGLMLLEPNTTAFFLPLVGAVKNKYAGLIYIGGLIYYQRKRHNSFINHEMHLLGALAGLAATFGLCYEYLN